MFFMKLMPKMWANFTKLASTLPYDIALMGDTQQGKLLEVEEWKRVAVPTRVLTSGQGMSLSFERFGGGWHPLWHSERSTTRPQLTAELRATTPCGTAFEVLHKAVFGQFRARGGSPLVMTRARGCA
ncbi:hypothetical protein [Streptomyces sp. Tu 4128]|uniref:hypothetical protein n=1 Tax=Streptomyces sp. Tu 4128 TaxID=1120314 RepID=UPI000F042C6F|nr:hypothetical protein [Streptomyces sp. Tu 4128]